MRQSKYWLVFLTASAGCLLVVNGSAAVAPEVRDEGKMFSVAAVANADERIRELYRHHGRDVLIETFATIPAADAVKVKAMDAEKRSEFFQHWGKQRIKERVVRGYYVLICKEPRYLVVFITENPPTKPNLETREAVENVLRKEFRAERFDSGLDLALKIIEDKLGNK